ESPLAVGTQLAQGCLGAIFLSNLPPAFVKHCQFGSAAVGSGASMISFPRWSAALCRGLAVLLFCGCATRKPSASSHPFVFHQDTFAYANETLWEYHIDPLTGKTTHTRRQPPPSYSLHCFVVARAAGQFFQFARFDSAQPMAPAEVYRRVIKRVVSIDPKQRLTEEQKIVI